MANKRKSNVQINISIPVEWKTELENTARRQQRKGEISPSST